jgi:hypothetical protein
LYGSQSIRTEIVTMAAADDTPRQGNGQLAAAMRRV